METTSEDFGFHLATDAKGLRVFDPISFESKPQNLNLLAIGNLTRTFACSNGSTLIIGTLSDLNQGQTDNFLTSQCNATQLAYNADHTVLYLLVNSAVHSVNIINGLSQKTITLTSLGIQASILSPSPTSPSQFAVVADQKLSVFDGNSKQLTSDSTFACFSHDGQLVYSAGSDATISVYTLSGEVTSSFQAPDLAAPKLIHLTEIVYPKLLVSYAYDDDGEEAYQSYIIDLKSEDREFAEVDVASAFGSAERSNWYYSASIADWVADYTYFFITSGKATELNTISYSAGFVETLIPANDFEGAPFPINDDTGDDASPVGLAVDLSCGDDIVKEPCEGLDQAQQLPKVWVLTNEGTLIAWWVFHRAQIRKNELSLQRSLERLQLQAKAATTQPSPAQTQKKEPATPIFGASGSTSTGFGGDTNQIAGGIGNTGAGSTVNSLSNMSEAGPVSFGAPTPAQAQSAGQHAFGSTSFGAVSFGKSGQSFGSTGFGSSDFGKSSFSKSSTSGSGFAAFANKPSSFASSSTTSGGSPFAALGNNKASPFGQLDDNIQKETKSSPFAALSSGKDSIFGNNDSEKKASVESAKNSLFGSSNNTNSLFDKNMKSAVSPFGSYEQKPSSTFSAQPTERMPIFGSSSGIANKTDVTKAFQASSTESPKAPDGFNNLSRSSVNLEEPQQLLGTMDLSSTDDATMMSSTSTLNQPFKDSSIKPSVLDNQTKSLFSNRMTDEHSKFSIPQARTNVSSDSESVDKAKDPSSFFNAFKHKSAMKESPFAKLNFDQENSKSLHETPKVVSETSGNEDIESYVDVGDSEGYQNDENLEENEDDNYVIVHSDDYNDAISDVGDQSDGEGEVELSLDELNILERKNQEAAKPVFEVFAGVTNTTIVNEGSYEQQLRDILDNTHGNFKVFQKNRALVERYLRIQGDTLIQHDFDALNYPNTWRLCNVAELRKLAQEHLRKTKSTTEALSRFEDDLIKLEGEISIANSSKNKIDKALAQLKLYSQFLNEENAKYYPLDPKNEKMQMRLRDKFANVEKLRDKLITNLTPLKARVNSKLTSVDRIQELLFHINTFLSKYEVETEGVQARLNAMNLIEVKQTNPHMDVSSQPNQFFQKWKVAESIEFQTKTVALTEL